jgi:putative SOS response-associated peptidase YedK
MLFSGYAMCGRFTLHLPPELLAEIFGLLEIPVFPARYNIAPTQKAAVIRNAGSGLNRLDFLQWGLIPPWAKDRGIGHKMINARAETVHEKPAFRHAIRRRRCLTPSSGFFEWRIEGKGKIPLYVRLKDGSPMVFAAIWESWRPAEGESVESFAILTTSSNELVAPLHDRMPVILHPREYRLWLDAGITDPAALRHLYRPFPADLMEMYPVSPLVNSPRNDTSDLIRPVTQKSP